MGFEKLYAMCVCAAVLQGRGAAQKTVRVETRAQTVVGTATPLTQQAPSRQGRASLIRTPSNNRGQLSIVQDCLLIQRNHSQGSDRLHFVYTKKRKPFSAASPGTALIAPSTCSPRSSFLFNLLSTRRKTVAIITESTSMPQFCAIAATGS